MTMKTEYVMMPKELSRADSEALFHSYGISDMEATYKDMVKVLSQPLPAHGWNDAIKAALAVLDSNPDESLTGQSLFRAVAQHEAIYNLIDQQPPAWRDMESAPRDTTDARE